LLSRVRSCWSPVKETERRLQSGSHVVAARPAVLRPIESAHLGPPRLCPGPPKLTGRAAPADLTVVVGLVAMVQSSTNAAYLAGELAPYRRRCRAVRRCGCRRTSLL